MKLKEKIIIFVNKKKFESLKSKNFFIETAKNFNNYYGSPFVNIQESKKEKNIYYSI